MMYSLLQRSERMKPQSQPGAIFYVKCTFSCVLLLAIFATGWGVGGGAKALMVNNYKKALIYSSVM